MTKIIIANNNWDKARAELKINLAAQNAAFNAQLKATFAPPAPETPAAAAQGTAKPKPGSRDESILSRSRLRG